MLLPKSMTKILIVGSKEKLEETIGLLYEMEAIHVVDFSAEEEEMSLGAPLKQASSASQKLLKLRSVQRDLEIEDDETGEPVAVSRIKKEFDEALTALEMETTGVADSKNKIQAKLSELDARKKELEPFVTLPLDLELYSGYDNITVFAGSVRADPEGVLVESLENYELFKSSDAKHIALFIDSKEAAEAQRLLVQNGYSEIAIPTGEGNPTSIIEVIESEEADLEDKLEEVSGTLDKLKEKHLSFVLAADEQLSIEVEKAETPLRFGATNHAFVVDAWIPTKSVKSIERTLKEKVGEEIHLEVLQEEKRKEHEEDGEEANDGDEAPTDFENGKTVGRFEYLIELVSLPKYKEADPTWLVSIFFPLFFGFMVGDLAYGLSFLILGWLGLRKCTTPEWRTIATMLFYGGIWACLIGIFFFGEALGMHFAPTGHEGDITWTALFQEMGIQFTFPHEIDVAGIFAIPLGVFSKLHDVKILLYISLWIGAAHLFVGFVMGAANVGMRHGGKAAFFEKVSWILILVGGVMFGLEMINILILGGDFVLGPMFIGGIALIIIGAILAVKAEGGAAILELPELMSNIFSYTRLTAIGMSKAGMALAFNTIAITLIAPSGGIMILFAILIFIFGHLMIFILAILSAGLHGIRLQYVEFFTKFFEGGGLKFNPLKIVRKHTTEV